ncbi:MAG: metalloregulator ArsR/SmtB family transcription factor [Vicinamibacteria bacterium]|nr:metalloregulator ArsR/SmtB family transcription factor [Vicinamibacteria bacterium]
MIRDDLPTTLVAWMDSLADCTRLRLLRLLERAEMGVAEMTEVLQLPQSTVSRHLKLLSERGWITSRGKGTANLYAMRVSSLPPAMRRLWPLVREQTEGWATARHDQLRLGRRLADRRRGARAFFARSASHWDHMRREMFGDAFGDIVLRGLLQRTLAVADLACGTGVVAAALAPHVNRVVGVDQSAAMLRAAARRLSESHNVELRQGELENLPLADASCDAALLVLALAYVSEPSIALREAARIVKPAGRIVVLDLLLHNRDDFRRRMGQQHNGFETNELRTLLTAANLNVDYCAPLPPEPSAKGPALLLACGVVQKGAHRQPRSRSDAGVLKERMT